MAAPASPQRQPHSQTMAEWHTDVIRALINMLDETCSSLRLACGRDEMGDVRGGRATSVPPGAPQASRPQP